LRRAGLFRHTIKDFRFITLILFVSITAMICAYTRASSHSPGEESAQQRRGNSRTQTRRRPPAAAARPRIDYSRFSHATKGHFENCASCHQIKSFEQPDIRDYPDHPSCTECHRQQFFRGARPVICSNCHTVTTPRSEARFKFPKENTPSQFADVFPHASHIKTTSLLQFEKVSGKKMNIQATCQHCHKLDESVPKLPASTPKDDLLPAGTFMTTPTSHTTCFACHWQEGVENRQQPPFATQCRECHRNEAKPLMQTVALSNALTTAPKSPASQTRAPLKLVPAVAQITQAAHLTSLPPRVAPKFVHQKYKHQFKPNENWKQGDDEKNKEVLITCTQCHAGVRKAKTLEAMRDRGNLVQLLSCSTSACHTALSGTTQLKLSVFRELRERGKDAKFDCALCHTPPISLKPEVPCSHYTAVLAAAKKENDALAKENESLPKEKQKRLRTLTGIEQLIPPRCAEAPKKEGS
jgi:hypothetical protein